MISLNFMNDWKPLASRDQELIKSTLYMNYCLYDCYGQADM